MKSSPPPPASSPRCVSIAMVVCVLIAVGLAVWFFAVREALTPLLYFTIYRLTTLLMGGLILLSAIALGLLVLELAQIAPVRFGERIAYAGGLGLGVISLGMLVLGLLGFMPGLLLWVLLFATVVLSALLLLRVWREAVAEVRALMAKPSIVTWLWLIIAVFFLMNLTGAFLPPHEYDVLEYHLAAPAAYNEADRIFFMPDNVYVSFPENLEMLFLLGMRLDTQRDGGTEVGKVVNIGIGLLAALAIAGLGARLFSPGSGVAAAAIFYTWPGVACYSRVAYVELLLMFYIILAVSAASRVFERHGRQHEWLWLAGLAGVFAGLAMGTKYTAVLILIPPLAVALVGLLGLQRRFRQALLAAVVFGAGLLVPLAPWLIKNVSATGNPVYPEAYGIFDGSQWSAEQQARWAVAHAAPHGEHEAGLVRRVWEFLAGSQFADFVLFVFVPLAVLRPGRERWAAWLLLGFFLVGAALWYGFTHRADRFLDPLAPLLALLSGAGVAWLATCWPRLSWTLLVVLLLVSPARYLDYRELAVSLPLALEVTRPVTFLLDKEHSEFAYVYPVMQFINESGRVPENARILFIGEARAYYCERDALVATVFNRQPIEEAFKDAHSGLDVFRNLTEKMGVTHILINTSELARLQDTYRFTFDGRVRPGMLDGFDWTLFNQFAREHLELMEWSPRDHQPHVDWSQWERQPMPGFVALYRIYP